MGTGALQAGRCRRPQRAGPRGGRAAASSGTSAECPGLGAPGRPLGSPWGTGTVTLTRPRLKSRGPGAAERAVEAGVSSSSPTPAQVTLQPRTGRGHALRPSAAGRPTRTRGHADGAPAPRGRRAPRRTVVCGLPWGSWRGDRESRCAAPCSPIGSAGAGTAVRPHATTRPLRAARRLLPLRRASSRLCYRAASGPHDRRSGRSWPGDAVGSGLCLSSLTDFPWIATTPTPSRRLHSFRPAAAALGNSPAPPETRSASSGSSVTPLWLADTGSHCTAA